MKRSYLVLAVAQILFVASLSQADPDEAPPAENGIKAEIVLDVPPPVYDSGTASPPMVTDDPGTAGVNKPEFTFIMANCDRSANGRSCESDINLATGINEKVEISIQKSTIRENISGEPSFRGAGASAVAVKYRFYDKNGLAMAIAPAYNFDDASRKRDAEGNQIPSDGRVVYIPLLVSKTIGKNTVVANIGFKSAIDHHENDSVTTSLAVGRALNDHSVIMGEISSQRDTDFKNKRSDVRIGYARVVFPDKMSQYQVSIGTSLGRSLGHTDDGAPHTTVLFYVKIVKK